MDDDEEELRDLIQRWCEEEGQYELARRVAFVPYAVLKTLLLETISQAEAILTKEGY